MAGARGVAAIGGTGFRFQYWVAGSDANAISPWLPTPSVVLWKARIGGGIDPDIGLVFVFFTNEWDADRGPEMAALHALYRAVS